MREFIGKGDRIVNAKNEADAGRQFASLTAEDAWRIKLGAGGTSRGTNGLGTYVAPSGKEYRARSLDAARAMHGGYRPSANADGHSAGPYGDPAINAAYAHRANIFGRFNGKPVARSAESLSAEPPPVAVSEGADAFAFRAAIFNRGAQR